MFEIKFVVKDKHLPQVLRSLEGISIEPPVVSPLSYEGELAAQAAPAKSGRKKITTEGLAQFIRSQGSRKVNVKTICEWVKSQGGNPGSYSHHLRRLIDDGTVKPTNMRGVYEVKG